MAQTSVDSQSPMNPRVQATGRKGSAASSRDGAKAPPSQDPSTTIQPSISHLTPATPTQTHHPMKYDAKTPSKAMNEQEDMENSMAKPTAAKARANHVLNTKQEQGGRRYGREANETDFDEDDGSVQSPYYDIKKMNNAQLRQHSMRRFGARYSDNETDDNIRGDIQKRMAMKTGMQRYRD